MTTATGELDTTDLDETREFTSADAEIAAIRLELEENDGYYEFPALFDTEGNLVNARICNTKFGQAWQVFMSNDLDRRLPSEWFSPSKDRNPARAVEKNLRKGFYVGKTREKAYVFMQNDVQPYSGAVHRYPIVRRDLQNPGEVIIVDNGFQE